MWLDKKSFKKFHFRLFLHFAFHNPFITLSLYFLLPGSELRVIAYGKPQLPKVVPCFVPLWQCGGGEGEGDGAEWRPHQRLFFLTDLTVTVSEHRSGNQTFQTDGEKQSRWEWWVGSERAEEEEYYWLWIVLNILLKYYFRCHENCYCIDHNISL